MSRNRNFLLLWLVTALTTLAIELFYVTVLVVIYEQTDSTVIAAGTMVARTLPSFLLGPLAGVLVDRFPRKTVLMLMDSCRLFLIVIAVLMVQGGGEVSVIGLYLVIAGLATAMVFHRPARLAMIPSLVSRDELVNANSLILVSTQIVLAIAYPIGGWLILIMPLGQIAVGIVALFIVAIVSTGLIIVPKAKVTDDDKRESMWRSFVAGLQYLRHHPIARPLTIMETVEHLPHGIWTAALMLAFTLQALDGDTADWGYQISGYFGGMIIGSLMALGMNRWLRSYPGRIIVANACATGFLTFAYAASQTVPVAVFAAFIFGPPFAIRDVAQDALLQGTVESGQLGRVYATREMLRNVVFMFAGVFFAALSEHVPIRDIYVVGGIIYLMTGLYALSNRALRESKMIPDAVQE